MNRLAAALLVFVIAQIAPQGCATVAVCGSVNAFRSPVGASCCVCEAPATEMEGGIGTCLTCPTPSRVRVGSGLMNRKWPSAVAALIVVPLLVVLPLVGAIVNMSKEDASEEHVGNAAILCWFIGIVPLALRTLLSLTWAHGSTNLLTVYWPVSAAVVALGSLILLWVMPPRWLKRRRPFA